MPRICIGLDSWIIQDGNHSDFAVGDMRRFALEFAGKKLVPSTSGDRTAKLLHTSIYQVHAEVIFVHPTVWVIDFGVRAFWEADPPDFIQIGSWVEGEVFVGIDPYFYKDYLSKLPDMPNLFRNWKVEAIVRNDTPWLRAVNDRGGVSLSRDSANTQWTEVQQTLAWDDDEGRSSYVLSCGTSEV